MIEMNSAGASKMTTKESLIFESLPPIIKGETVCFDHLQDTSEGNE